MAAGLMVESVSEYIYRMRPLSEWTDYTTSHYSPKEFLTKLILYLRAFGSTNEMLLAQCVPDARLIGLQPGLESWLRST